MNSLPELRFAEAHRDDEPNEGKGNKPTPLLSHEELVPEESAHGGVVLLGSHVKKTTTQIRSLQKAMPELNFVM